MALGFNRWPYCGLSNRGEISLTGSEAFFVHRDVSMDEKESNKEKRIMADDIIQPETGEVDPADAEPFGYAHGYRDAIRDAYQARLEIAAAESMNLDWPLIIAAMILAVVAVRFVYATD